MSEDISTDNRGQTSEVGGATLPVGDQTEQSWGNGRQLQHHLSLLPGHPEGTCLAWPYPTVTSCHDSLTLSETEPKFTFVL